MVTEDMLAAINSSNDGTEYWLLKLKKVVNKSAEMIKLSLNNEEKLAMGQDIPFNKAIVPMNYSPK